MNSLVLKIAAGAVGGFIAYKIADHYLNRPYEWPEPEITDQPADAPADENTVEEKPTTEEPAPEVFDNKAVGKKKRKEIIVDYTRFRKPDEDKGDLEELAAKYRTPAPEENTAAVDPSVISMDEYVAPSAYDKIVLTYYDIDKVLCDPAEEIISDWACIGGKDTLEKFGVESEDPDVVYVRNVGLGTMYEIARVRGSYKISVLGEEPDEEPAPRKRKKGKKDDEWK